MVRRRMEGREIPDKEVQSMKEGMDFDRTAYKKEKVENPPTMQTGYNKNLTIKEEEIKPLVYEIDGRDKGR